MSALSPPSTIELASAIRLVGGWPGVMENTWSDSHSPDQVAAIRPSGPWMASIQFPSGHGGYASGVGGVSG